MATANSWRSVLAAHNKVQASLDVFELKHYDPARAAWQDRVAAVPPVVIPYKDAAGFDHEMRSDQEWSLWRAEQVVSGKRDDGPLINELCHQFLQEVEARNVRVAACGREFDPIYDELWRLEDETAEACDAVFNHPVASLSELAEKIAFIERESITDDERVNAAIRADIRRLAGEA